MNHLTAKHVDRGQGRVVNVLGNNLRLILSATDTGGTLEFVELTAMPGVGIPPHIHSQEDETFLIVEGQVEFVVGDETLVLGPGSTVFGARNVPHGYRIIGEEPCRIYFTVTPATMEPMFDQLAALESPDPEKIGSICKSFGIEFLPPPG